MQIHKDRSPHGTYFIIAGTIEGPHLIGYHSSAAKNATDTNYIRA
jgi:hypothetical protein